MTINAFKALMKGGGARPNQFRVLLSFPNNLVANPSLVAAQSGFMVTSAELPASQIGVASAYYRGRRVKFGGEREFLPWNVTVINDTGFEIRRALEEWQNAINDLQTNYGVTNPRIYQTDAEVQQLGRNNEVLKTYKLHNVFPTDIGAIPLDFGNNDVIEYFPVSFEYDHFTTDLERNNDFNVNIRF